MNGLQKDAVLRFLANAPSRLVILVAMCQILVVADFGFPQAPALPVEVRIQDEKPEVIEPVLPIDPQLRAQPQFVGNMMSYGLNVDGKRLTFGAGSGHTLLHINGRITQPNARQEALEPGPRGQKRHGIKNVWSQGNLHITQIMEIVPGKPSGKVGPGQKRLMDTLLIRYVVENKDNQPHKVGVRMFIDTYCWTTDGCLFASPLTKPNTILNGVELKDKDVPDYLQILQNPNLQNPGWVAHFTFRMGNRYEPPNRVVLTNLGVGGDGWNVPAVPAGDSAVAFFWDPREIKANSKREFAFAHGQGIATNPENEGKVTLTFGGSFEPKKIFTVTAYVDDPVVSQSLTLELPAGMELVEGKTLQPVPPPGANGNSLVLWKARVLETGAHTLRVRSSNGVTHSRLITIRRPDVKGPNK